MTALSPVPNLTNNSAAAAAFPSSTREHIPTTVETGRTVVSRATVLQIMKRPELEALKKEHESSKKETEGNQQDINQIAIGLLRRIDDSNNITNTCS